MANHGEMVLDRVDLHDHPIGTVRRRDALAPGVGFRVVHVLLFDEHKRLLLQRIASSHDRHPCDWGSSVAGYVRVGETYDQAARRKLHSELGVTSLDLRWIGKTVMFDEGARKFIGVFVGDVGNVRLRPNPADFAEHDFVALQIVEREIATRARSFTPTFESVVGFAFPRLQSTP